MAWRAPRLILPEHQHVVVFIDITCRQPATRAARVRTPRPRICGRRLSAGEAGLKPNATRFSILGKLRYSWGRTPVLRPTSTPASSCSDMADSVARRAGPGENRADREVSPTTAAAIPDIGKTSGIRLKPAHIAAAANGTAAGGELRSPSGSRGTRADQGIGVKISYAELRLVGEDCWPASGILMNCAGDRDSPRFVSIAKRPCLGRRRVAPTASYEIETRRYADT